MATTSRRALATALPHCLNGGFTPLPPHRGDGRRLFTRAAATWRPLVAPFLRRHGFEIDA